MCKQQYYNCKSPRDKDKWFLFIVWIYSREGECLGEKKHEGWQTK